MKIHEIRRLNVTALIEQEYEGKSANLANALDVQPSEISRRLNIAGKETRNFGDDFSRRIEAISNKPEGWLDQIHDATKTAPKGVPVLTLEKLTQEGWEKAVKTPAKEYVTRDHGVSDLAFALRMDTSVMGNEYYNELVVFDPMARRDPGNLVLVWMPDRELPIFRRFEQEGGCARFVDAQGVPQTYSEGKDARILARACYFPLKYI